MNENGFTCKSISATETVKSGGGVLKGFFVSSHTNGSITIYDNTAASGKVILAAFAIPSIGFFDLGTIGFGTGLHVVIANTAVVTMVYK